MNKSTNALNWFEIPVTDINRATSFYEHVFGIEMSALQEMGGMKMCGFPSEPGNGKASGALVQSPAHIPSMNGSVIYLNANPEIQPVIEKLEKLGTKILLPKTLIAPEVGFMAFFIDSEGNKIGLHAQK